MFTSTRPPDMYLRWISHVYLTGESKANALLEILWSVDYSGRRWRDEKVGFGGDFSNYKFRLNSRTEHHDQFYFYKRKYFYIVAVHFWFFDIEFFQCEMPSDALTVAVTTGLGVSVLAGILSGICYILTHGIPNTRLVLF